MNKTKIYIAGKITGDSSYRRKFRVAKETIESDSVVVLNPADLPSGMSQADYMRICLAMIDCADIVFLLPDWKDSPGARIERAYAVKCGKQLEYG